MYNPYAQQPQQGGMSSFAIIIVVVIVLIAALGFYALQSAPTAPSKPAPAPAPSSGSSAPAPSSGSGSSSAPAKVYNWKECASEGGLCKSGSSGKVRYHAKNIVGKRFNPGDIVDCSTTTFGSDPLPGVYKACYTSTEEDPYPFNECAREFQGCKVGPGGIVVYASHAHKQLVANAGSNVTCNNNVMGGDPTPNIYKACYTDTE